MKFLKVQTITKTAFTQANQLNMSLTQSCRYQTMYINSKKIRDFEWNASIFN